MNKPCSKCKLIQEITEFYPDHRLKSGLSSRCKTCHSEKRIRLRKSGYQQNYLRMRRYGISEEDYNVMLEQQQGLCKLCRKKQSDYFCRTKNLIIDHDHSTGKVRGLICSPCNLLLGKIEKYYNNNLNIIIQYLTPEENLAKSNKVPES